MVAVVPNPNKIKSFPSEQAFEQWLSTHHATEDELWLKIYKKDSGKPTVSYAQAVDVALCWGWIDGLKKAFDEHAFLQRFTPRKAKSVWSQINREKVAALIAGGRMTEHGLAHVTAARADGRWDQAYAPIKSATADTIPADLRTAIEANPRALTTFEKLGKQNLFALTFRVNSMKTEAGRARKIQTLVDMLARGEMIVPQSDKPRSKAAIKSR